LHKENVVPRYRLSGNYFFPPDRGSAPGGMGEKKPMQHEFTVADEAAALEHVANFRKDKVDIVDAKLVSIDVPAQHAQTTQIELPTVP
jgi:hypothetical protein